MRQFRLSLLLIALVFHSRSHSLTQRLADPRHNFDPRCPPAVTLDPPETARVCSHCGYFATMLAATATPNDCSIACCGDWSCLSFIFTPAGNAPSARSLEGSWVNHDSLRGSSGVSITQTEAGIGAHISARSLDPSRAFWTTAQGTWVTLTSLFLCFDCTPGHTNNNRTGTISADFQSISFDRLPFDPLNFTQV